MRRKDFIKICGLLGIAIPTHTILSACADDNVPALKDQKVIVIGAGPAGMSAAYLLTQRGIEVQVLEANSYHGGRIIRNTEFADFPIPLGAEWLHVDRGIFDEIVNDTSTPIEIKTTPYNADEDYGLFNGERISVEQVGFTIDQKFINATWFDFYETYVVPDIISLIKYNTVVTTINYTDDQIVVSTQNESFVADKVIITVPVKLLQNESILFEPPLPSDKVQAIQNVKVWDGCKAFIVFSEKFYPAFTAFEITPESDGQKLYYDAAYGQNSDQNVLGLFAVGTGTQPYVDLSDTELISYILDELDQIYDGQASRFYLKHIFQNWNTAQFANGAYIYDQENWRTVRTLGESINNKLFFAGDGYTTGEDWSSVHAAARSARRAVDEILD